MIRGIKEIRLNKETIVAQTFQLKIASKFRSHF